MIRKVIPDQNRLPVRNQTNSAKSTAGMSIRSRRISIIIMIPTIMSAIRAIKSICSVESKIPKTAKIPNKGYSTAKPHYKKISSPVICFFKKISNFSQGVNLALTLGIISTCI